MKKHTIILSLILFSSVAFSQNKETMRELPTAFYSYDKDSLMQVATNSIIFTASMIDSDSNNIDLVRRNLNLSIDALRFYQKTYGANSYSHWWLGLSYFYLEDYTSSITEFNKAIKNDSDYFKSYEMRGFCKQKLKDNYGAVSDFDRVISIAPPNYSRLHELYAAKTECLIEIAIFENDDLEIFDQAVRSIEMAIELSPENGFYFYKKALLLGIQGNPKAACLSLSKAGELGYIQAYKTIAKNCN